jgi:hypothetical protein
MTLFVVTYSELRSRIQGYENAENAYKNKGYFLAPVPVHFFQFYNKKDSGFNDFEDPDPD